MLGHQDVGRLLDFDYTDNDVESLRLQMRLPGSPPKSPLSDLLEAIRKYCICSWLYYFQG